MNKLIIALILFLNMFYGPALADNSSRIELNDGSVIVGEISDFYNGTYTINSEQMGRLKIDEANIKQITFAKNNPAPSAREIQPASSSSTASSSADINSMANKMMSDKETMGMVMSLQNDPQFQSVINDPEIINAVKSGNISGLMSNDKFMQLQNNPTIQKIKERTSE